jgi:hypothetical protein
MAALTAERNTPRLGADVNPYDFPIAANVKIFAGAMVAIDATNKRALPARATATDKVVGCARETYDNTGGARAAFRIRVFSGVFRFNNSSSGDAITQADVGGTCYVVDDQTVAKTDNSSARPAAGKIMDVDSIGVWVQVRHDR